MGVPSSISIRGVGDLKRQSCTSAAARAASFALDQQWDAGKCRGKRANASPPAAFDHVKSEIMMFKRRGMITARARPDYVIGEAPTLEGAKQIAEDHNVERQRG